MSDIANTSPQARFSLKWLASPWTLVVAIPLAVLILDPARVVDFTAFAANAFLGTFPISRRCPHDRLLKGVGLPRPMWPPPSKAAKRG